MLQPGDTIAGTYRLERLLGKGGMGEVWLVHHNLLEEYRAIKVVLSDITNSPQLRERFIRGEARNSLKLDRHPNIVRVYDLGQHNGMPYIVMEYVDGINLRQFLNRHKPLSPAEVAPMLEQITKALDVAHRQNLIHRDIKPANILIDQQGVLKLSDFGLTKNLVTNQSSDLTHSGQFIGTPAYTSPEQSEGEADQRSDVYSLAAVVYEMLTGKPPFSGPTPSSVIIKHATTPPPPLHHHNPNVPTPIEEVVLKALSKRPEDRYQTALEFSAAYQQALILSNERADSETIEIPPSPPKPKNTPAIPVLPVTPPISSTVSTKSYPPVVPEPPAHTPPPIPPGPQHGQTPPPSSTPPPGPPPIYGPGGQPTPPPYQTPPNYQGMGGYPPYYGGPVSNPSNLLPPRRDNRSLIAGVIVVILLIVVAVLAGLLIINRPSSSTPTPVAVANTTVIASPTVALPSPTIAPSLTTAPTTAVVVVVTTAAAIANTPSPTVEVSPTPTVTPSPTPSPTLDPNETLFNTGKEAHDKQDWQTAIDNFERIPTASSVFARAKPLLIKAYSSTATAAIDTATTTQQGNTLEAAQKTAALFKKALDLDPDNTDLKTASSRAEIYSQSRAQYDNRQCNFAITPLGDLYSQVKTGNPDGRYRDTAELYYNCLVGLGDEQLQQGKLPEARDWYSKALAITVADKSAAQSGLNKTNPTPTPLPTATATPKPPLGPCDKGGSGSNFFAFSVGQPGVPDVADRGSSAIQGRVLNRNRQPMAGATVLIFTNGQSFSATTDGGGNYYRGGLGRGIWTVQVVGAPVTKICYTAPASVTLSGQAGFVATAEFVESVP